MENKNEDKKLGKDVYVTLFKSIIGEVLNLSSTALLIGGTKYLEDKEIEEYMTDNKVQAYMYISGFLNLLGRDISRDNMCKVLKSIDINPDTKTIDALLQVNSENDVIYIYSIYLLNVLGKQTNIKNIMSIVGSLGIKPNEAYAENALELYNNRYKNL
jgi:ribosomal protein L12E/L44/L45/RPP1/RPP2